MYSRTSGRRLLVKLLAGLGLMIIATSCTRKPMSPREKLQWAFGKEESDPETTYLVLTQDLPGNRDTEVIDLLLDYLKQRRNSRAANFDNIRLVIAYMEDISGINSHMESSASGSVYRDMAGWDTDIEIYRDWWAQNRDRIGWDDAAQSLRVIEKKGTDPN